EVAIRLSDVSGGVGHAQLVHAVLADELSVGQLSRCRSDSVPLQDPAHSLPIWVEQHAPGVQEHDLDTVPIDHASRSTASFDAPDGSVELTGAWALSWLPAAGHRPHR